MNASKTNIRFNYLYRDAGNYKNFGSVVFSNPKLLSTETLIKPISSSLIDGEYFYHNRLGVPALFFSLKNSDDHFWHEFENIEETNDEPTDTRTINEFLNSFSKRQS
jgi:hypothetical protein